MLGRGPRTRAALIRRLRLGIRGYYRDLEILRTVGLLVELVSGKYYLREDLAPALERLPLSNRASAERDQYGGGRRTM